MLPDITNYIPDPNNGRPIANGQVYFFIDGYMPPTNIADVNPAFIAGVTANGNPLPQPIYTTQGGVLRTGSLANMPPVSVAGNVKRVAVYDKCGKLVYSTAYNGVGAFVDADALAAPNSTVLVGGVEAGDLGRRFRQVVNVRDFGAVGDGVTDDWAAITAAVQFAHAQGNREIEIVLPTGNYALSQTLQLGYDRLKLRGQGQVYISALNAMTSVININNLSLIYDMLIEDITLIGLPSVAIGMSMQNVVHATFRNIRVRNVTEYAFYVEGAVLNLYENIICSRNENFLNPAPNYGLYLTNGEFGGTSTANVFTNCMFEGMREVGLFMQRADNNTFYGGTSEAHDSNSGTLYNGLGIYISELSTGNIFHNFFCEVNPFGGDLICLGKQNQFYGSAFASAAPTSPFEAVRSVIIKGGAEQNVFKGCYMYSTLVETGSEANEFSMCRLAHRIDDSGTRTIKEYTLELFNSTTIYPNIELGNIENPNPLSLDWYEEGSFTPAFGGSASDGSIIHDVQNGSFTRIGNIVNFTLTLRVSTVSTAPAGDLLIKGLPYPSSNTFDHPCTVGRYSAVTLPASRSTLGAEGLGGTSHVRLIGTASGLDTLAVDASTLAALSLVAVSGSYRV